MTSPRSTLTMGTVARRALTAMAAAAVIPLSACTACVVPDGQPAPPRVPAEATTPASPPPVSRSSGLWLSPGELAALPTSGSAWADLNRAARASWGSPSLSDNNADHDTSTLAGALVAARTGDAALRDRTRAAIMAATRVTSYARTLELSRNITSYVIAADIVGLPAQEQATFRSFISQLRTKPLQGHSGAESLLQTALFSGTNWGTMARAAMTSIDLYLGDRAQLAQVANAHRAWLGEAVPNQMRWSDTAWHVPGRPKVGIQPRGARIGGQNVDGVQPEDQRRTGEPGSGAAPKGSYPWEALQGGLVTGVLLHRAGVVDIRAGDRALERAFTWLYVTNANPPSGDDRWQPWLLNSVAGTRFATVPAPYPGKNMGWTQWTHGR